MLLVLYVMRFPGLALIIMRVEVFGTLSSLAVDIALIFN